MKSNNVSYAEPNFIASTTIKPLLLTAMTDKTVKPGEIFVVGGEAMGIVYTGREVAEGDNAPISVLYTGVVKGNGLTGLTDAYKEQLKAKGVKFVEDLNNPSDPKADAGNTTQNTDNKGGQ